MPPYETAEKGGDPDGTRTRVAAVKGRSLNRLTTGPFYMETDACPFFIMVAATGFEPVTPRV